MTLIRLVEGKPEAVADDWIHVSDEAPLPGRYTNTPVSSPVTSPTSPGDSDQDHIPTTGLTIG